MKSSMNCFLCALLVMLSAGVFAQAPASKIKEKFQYTFQQSDGTNASAVAWDATHKVYVTVIAGNMEYPLEVFSAKGKPITQSSAGFDWRGMWYNPETKDLEGNGYGDFGWAAFSLEDGNNPTQPTTIFEGEMQPDDNLVGAFEPIQGLVAFLDMESEEIALYKRTDPEDFSTVVLDWEDVEPANINLTSLGCTGHLGYEYVLLDFYNGKLVFFNAAGKLAARSQLPKNAPLNDSFAFSFANGHAFLYDKEARIWHAYKVW